APSEEPNGHTVIIGIDFGTTFSGVAFTWSDKNDKTEVITSWPSELHSNSDEQKSPTVISFATKGKADWGYSILGDAEQLKWFKLLLVDSILVRGSPIHRSRLPLFSGPLPACLSLLAAVIPGRYSLTRRHSLPHLLRQSPTTSSIFPHTSIAGSCSVRKKHPSTCLPKVPGTVGRLLSPVFPVPQSTASIHFALTPLFQNRATVLHRDRDAEPPRLQQQPHERPEQASANSLELRHGALP
ncbi:hypothetical protein C8A05DRAFT_12540, partial [Staphylotrichum tortipilum]